MPGFTQRNITQIRLSQFSENGTLKMFQHSSTPSSACQMTGFLMIVVYRFLSLLWSWAENDGNEAS